jgi:hypothetical protein
MGNNLDVLSISLLTYLVLYYAARRSLNDFFAKNETKLLKENMTVTATMTVPILTIM